MLYLYLCLAFQVFIKAHSYIVLFNFHSISTNTDLNVPEMLLGAYGSCFMNIQKKISTGKGFRVPIWLPNSG